MFFSAEAILLLYILFLTFWFTICFHLTWMIFAEYLGPWTFIRWPPFLDFWVWGGKVSRACSEDGIPFRKVTPTWLLCLPFSDGLMDDNLHFHHNNLKAAAPLTGMELRTPAQDSFFPKMRQLFTASPPPLEMKVRNVVPGQQNEGPHASLGRRFCYLCQMVRNGRRICPLVWEQDIPTSGCFGHGLHRPREWRCLKKAIPRVIEFCFSSLRYGRRLCWKGMAHRASHWLILNSLIPLGQGKTCGQARAPDPWILGEGHLPAGGVLCRAGAWQTARAASPAAGTFPRNSRAHCGMLSVKHTGTLDSCWNPCL